MFMTMVQFSYKPEAMQNLIKNPEDRSKGLKTLIENLDGKLHAFYYTYGEYDGFAIIELPDSTSAVAASIVSANPATLAKIKTTVIITVQEAMDAMKKAQGLSIVPPKG
jgi:uncharacterized protein with GYD domain